MNQISTPESQHEYCAKTGFQFFTQNLRILIFPLLTMALTLTCIIVVSAFVFGNSATPLFALHPILATLSAVLLYFISIIFIPMWIRGAMFYFVLQNMQQQRCGIFHAFGATLKRWQALLGWSAITCSIGIIMHSIESRGRFLGGGARLLLGFSWRICTYLVMPMMIAQDIGPIKAIKQGVNWGRNRTSKYISGDIILMIFNFCAALFGVAIAFILINTSFISTFFGAHIYHWFGWSAESMPFTNKVIAIVIALFIMQLLSSTISCIMRSTVYLSLAHDDNKATEKNG